MRSSSEKIRLKWALNMDFTPDYDMVEHGVKDPAFMVRKAWLSRTDWTATPEQIKKGLQESTAHDLKYWLLRPEVRVSEDQVLQGLTQHEDRRLEWISARTYQMTDKIAQMALSDPSSMVQVQVLRRDDWTPAPWHIHDILTSSEPTVIRVLLQRKDWTPTAEQVEQGIHSYDWRVREAWAMSTLWTPTTAQADILLQDPMLVRKSLLSRTDWEFTDAQVEKGLQSPDKELWEQLLQNWKARIHQEVEYSMSL